MIKKNDKKSLLAISLSLLLFHFGSAQANNEKETVWLWPDCQQALESILTHMGVNSAKPEGESHSSPKGQQDPQVPSVTKVEFLDYDFGLKGTGGFKYEFKADGKLTLRFVYNTRQGNAFSPPKKSINLYTRTLPPSVDKKSSYFEIHEFQLQKTRKYGLEGCEFESYSYTPEAHKNRPLTKFLSQRDFLDTCGAYDITENRPKNNELFKYSNKLENSPYICYSLRPNLDFNSLMTIWHQVMQAKRPLPDPQVNDVQVNDDQRGNLNIFKEKRPRVEKPTIKPKLPIESLIQ